ncbi:hypothetical protein VP1G_10753 [Cytospora mali]|uniref:Uncharacterized protein n=1 Tax=Cytospora mali TaxID=578113 RepID=A0A194UUW5_CYTMA|nr:hypothetical protein VP1G_10753 [Valsa mali var. pyri (nom. inval.)]
METRSRLKLSDIAHGHASQIAVVVVQGINPGTALADFQSAVSGSGASGWDLLLDAESSEMTLEIRFKDKEDAESYIAGYKSGIYGHMPLKPTLPYGQWSPTFTSSTTGPIETPCSTTANSISETASTIDIGSCSDAVPWPGKTYKIRHRASQRLIILEEGRLKLKHPGNIKAVGGWNWVCAEQNGWLGFRSPVSATYMGHDKRGNIWSTWQHHEIQESFCVRRHPAGGYIILVKHGDGRELWPIVANKEGEALIEKKNGDDQWLFEEV